MTSRFERTARLLPAVIALALAVPALAQTDQPLDPMGQMMPMDQMPMGQTPMGQMPMGQMPMGQMPMQPGMQPMQPGMQPMQPGMQPMQPGMQPMQPGMQPMQPGMQPGMQPMQPGMQPMQPGMQPMQPGMQPMQPGMQPGMDPRMQQMLQQAMMYESQNFGVPATDQLHQGPAHGPTPTTIPGARLVSTFDLMSMLQAGQRVLLVDVLGGQQTIPGSLVLPQVGSGQSFDDQVQQQLKASLEQATGGDRNVPVIFYCLGPQCWLSYNAALRASRLGFANVGWYRGGLEVWGALGLPMQQAGMQQQPQFQPQPQPQFQPQPLPQPMPPPLPQQ
jgi:PQQ-dependent catabolism-associated CXXCW motif protein